MKCLANERTYKRIQEQSQMQTISFFSIVFASVLTDKFGFSKQKIQQVVKLVTRRVEEIKEDRISLDDLKSILYEEYGINIEQVEQS